MRIRVVVVGGGVVLGASCAPPGVEVAGPIATGTTPNDVVLGSCEGESVALVTASGDARLDVLVLDGSDDAPRAVFLDEGSQPWMVDVDLDGARAVVSLFGTNEVALVSPCEERVLARAQADVVFDVDPPLTLRDAADADGDGQSEISVTRMRPRSPQAVAVVDDAVFVTFTNIFAFASGDDPMLTGPGSLARFVIDGDELRFVDVLTLPCENPGGIASNGVDVVVTCSGRFIVSGAGHQRQSPGGVVVVDVAGSSIRGSISLPDFSPGTPAFVGTDVVVGNLLGGELRRYGPELVQVDSVVLGSDNESIFSVVPLGDDVAATLFLGGGLVLSPFGTRVDVPVAAAGPARGLIDVVIDDDAALGLLTLSAQLVRVELP